MLYAEDDKTPGFVTKDRLEEEGFYVKHCKDGQEGLEQFKLSSFDACILDVMIPRMDGFVLAREIRKRSPGIPVLFLSAKSMKEDRIAGFKTGADDYITKPFSIEELILRLQVFLRKSGKVEQQTERQEHRFGAFVFYPDRYQLLLGDEEIKLTERENDLLSFFCSHANEVVRREEILRQVWGKDDYFSGRSLDVFVSRLRKLLTGDPKVHIDNIHGVGFRFHY